MKKSLILLTLLLMLSACNNSNNKSTNNLSNISSSNSSNSSSSEIKLDTVENVLKALKDNFTVNYTSPNGSFNIYKTKDYIYDEELGGGQFILYDDSMYVYTIHNNQIVPKTPSSGTRADYDNFYPNFNIDINNFTVENGVYTTTDENTLTQLGLLINSLPESKASLFMDKGFLNFRFFDSFDKVVITGKVYGIGSTSVASIENYLESNIDPETETFENSPLIEVLGNLDDNFTFFGEQKSNNQGLTMILNENYVASFTGTMEDKENYYGYISLEDGTHYFSIENDVTTVDFEISADKNFIKENYLFKRHDFSKFKLIEENTYISSDYYNVQNFCDLLVIDGTSINMVKIKVDPTTKNAQISLMHNHDELYTGVISNIGSSEITQLSSYLDGTKKPDLQHYDNEELVNATKNLSNNYTFVRTDEVLDEIEKDFYGAISTENGRKDYRSSYSNFPSTDYLVYDDVAFSYVLDENSISPLVYKSISKEDYELLYTFDSIDFTHFLPTGENTWITNSKKYMRILSNLFGSNPYDEYHYQAKVELIDGVLHFEISDTSFGVNVSGYLKDINETSLPLVDDYKTTNSKPVAPSYDNSELINVISKLRNECNFTVEYHDDPEYGLYFTAGDYDYWTKDAIYFGSYKDGFVTGEKSGYVYNFGWITNEEDDTKIFTVADHPSLYMDQITDYNPFKDMTNELIKTIMPYENSSYITFDSKIVEVFVNAMQLQGSSMLGYAGVILEIINGELVAHVIDIINVSYDENGKRSENYDIFASATFTKVGTTVIPSFANLPSIK